MKFKAQQIAELLQGTIEGNSNIEVSTLSKIESGEPGTLSFLANPKYTKYIYSTRASIVIVSNDFVPSEALPETLTLIRVEDPYTGFSKLLSWYENLLKPKKKGIHPSAVIESSATIGDNVFIGAQVYIGNNTIVGNEVHIDAGCILGDRVKLGARSQLYPSVKILDDCIVGEDCALHAGVIIGGDGFGFAPNSDNFYHKVPQLGNVVIEDHVEIGANTTIDRSTLGSTIIRKGVKLDNLIQVAHNVEIGENTVIAAQTGIAGSTKIGKNCLIGGQVGIIGHIVIADGVKIAAQSGIGHSIENVGAVFQGSPAIPIVDFKKSYYGFKNLPQILRDIQSLKNK